MEYYQTRADLLPRIHFVDDTEIFPPYVHKRRRPGEYIIYLIKSGEMFLKEGEVTYTLQEGDCIVLDQDRIHAGVKASTCAYYYIHFKSDEMKLKTEQQEGELAELMQQHRQRSLKSKCYEYEEESENVPLYLPKYFHVSDRKTLTQAEGLLQQAKEAGYRQLEGYKVLQACLVQEMLILLTRSFLTAEQEKSPHQQPAYYPTVQKLQEWLNREYAGKITGGRIEQEFGGNFDYMNRVFKKVTGQTIFSYLTNVRMERAKMLLTLTPMRVREVCEQVGYPDVYYFSRVFKKTTGVSPAAFADMQEEKSL